MQGDTLRYYSIYSYYYTTPWFESKITSKTTKYIIKLIDNSNVTMNYINTMIEHDLKQEQRKLIQNEENITFLTILRKASQLIINKLCDERLLIRHD